MQNSTQIAPLHVDRVRIVWKPDGERQSCRAEAQLSYPISEQGDRRLDWLSSGGLYGIDEPSPSYQREVEEEQLNDLRGHLEAFGIVLSDKAWAEAKRGPRGVQACS